MCSYLCVVCRWRWSAGWRLWRVEQLEALVPDAYQRACAGEERAKVQMRRLLTALNDHQADEADEAGDAAVDADEPRRQGDLVVPVGTPRDVVLALAREKAAALVGAGRAGA
jgi:hypothetical protein